MIDVEQYFQRVLGRQRLFVVRLPSFDRGLQKFVCNPGGRTGWNLRMVRPPPGWGTRIVRGSRHRCATSLQWIAPTNTKIEASANNRDEQRSHHIHAEGPSM